MDADVVIVGAGVAGLSCAARAAEHGLRVLVLDKGRGVGGRCATRRIDGQPVDHGLAFYHGDDPAFREALLDASDDAIDGWPFRVTGSGRPCASAALRPDQSRVAFAAGATTFPKSLAETLDVRTRVRVVAIERADDGVEAVDDDGRRYRGRDLVLALPAAQALRLADPLTHRDDADLDAAAVLLRTMAGARCLTTIALYDRADGPPWDVCYPSDARSLQLISHDSAKREAPWRTALVLQAPHGWSVAHWDDRADSWAAGMLRDAAAVIGPWVASPDRVDTMRWRHARAGGPDEVAGPMLCGTAGSGRLGIAGECFGPDGGVQAAWHSGRTLADRLADERSSR